MKKICKRIFAIVLSLVFLWGQIPRGLTPFYRQTNTPEESLLRPAATKRKIQQERFSPPTETQSPNTPHEPTKHSEGAEHQTYDDILIEEIARRQGVSIDDLESDFERTVNIEEERMRFKGFISPDEDKIVKISQNIFKKLITQVQAEGKDFAGNFYFVDDNTVNAFVFRNRTDVYFFKGLYETLVEIAGKMQKPLTEGAIAFIIAHELAHSIQHTSLKGLTVRDFKKDMPNYIIQMMKNAEYDADRKALELMDKAGYSVFGAIDGLAYLEYISHMIQAETVLSSHPYTNIRKHRLSQIIFEQSTNIFPNAKKSLIPLVHKDKIPSRDIDFRNLLASGDEDIAALAEDAKDFDQAKGVLLTLATRQRMAIMKALKNNEAIRLAFARSIYLDAAFEALKAYGKRKGLNLDTKFDHHPVDYHSLQQAAAVCEFGADIDASGVMIALTDSFSSETREYFQKIRKELKKPDFLGEKLDGRTIRFINSYLRTIEQQYNRINALFLDNLLRDPEEVTKIIGLFQDTSKEAVRDYSRMLDDEEKPPSTVPELEDVFQDPQRLVSAYLYGRYLGQTALFEITDPVSEVKFRIEKTENTLYMENPRYWDIKSSETRERLEEILIAHYLTKISRTDVLTGEFSYIDYWAFSGINQYIELPQTIIDQVFLALWKTAKDSYPEVLQTVIPGRLISHFLNVDAYPSYIDGDVVEKIILSRLPPNHPAKTEFRSLPYETRRANRDFAKEIEDRRYRLLAEGADYETFKREMKRFIRSHYHWEVLAKDEITPPLIQKIQEDMINSVVPSQESVFKILYANTTREGLLADVKRQSEKISGDYKNEMNNFLQQHPFITAFRGCITENEKLLPDDFKHEFREETHKLLVPGTDETDIYIRLLETLFQTVYESRPKRNPHASEIFRYETNLDFADDSTEVRDFGHAETLPEWIICDMINQKGWGLGKLDFVKGLIVEDPNVLERIFTFMREKLPFDERKEFFNAIFFDYYKNKETREILTSFFNEKFGNDYQQIILWFLGMFSKQDALTFIEKYVSKLTEEFLGSAEISEKLPLLINLFEYIYSEASSEFHPDPDNVKWYLELIKLKYSFNAEQDPALVKEGVYHALGILAPAVGLKLTLYDPEGVSPEGSNDFRTKTTSIKPQFDWKSAYLYASYSLDTTIKQHNFAWNDEKTQEQSPFVCFMMDLSTDELKALLEKRRSYVENSLGIEYREENFVRLRSDDFFAEFIEHIILQKLYKRRQRKKTAEKLNHIEALGKMVKTEVTYHGDESTRKLESINCGLTMQHNQGEINAIPINDFLDTFSGYAIPSEFLDEVIEDYIEDNSFYNRFPDFVKLLQKPNDGIHYLRHALDYMKDRRHEEKVSYRSVMAEILTAESAYSRLFEEYCNKRGKGYVRGRLYSLKQRLVFINQALPHKSLLRDNVIDLWEAQIFPEIIEDMPELLKMLSSITEGKDTSTEIWNILKNVDDDIGKLQKIEKAKDLNIRRIDKLLDFYRIVIPLILSPQRRSRYGATAYLLWIRLPQNQKARYENHIQALVEFMPEPSILRDEMLTKITNRHARTFGDIYTVLPLLYANNILASDRDLRTEDFLAETVVSLFSVANRNERKEVLLWIQGNQAKPEFVEKIEDRYKISFDTLPRDMVFLPAAIRDKFIEAFMLGDNGLLDPRVGRDGQYHPEDEKAMTEYLEALFFNMFPPGSEGIEEEDRQLLSKVFTVVMKAYDPYRRVHVIKAFADLKTRINFAEISTGERLAVVLGAVGPVGIKVAQYLSENETLVSDPGLRSRLGALRNRAPEITKVSGFSLLIHETPQQGALVVELGEPLGIASMGQVNRGKWVDINRLIRKLQQLLNEDENRLLDAKMKAHQSQSISIDEFIGFLLTKVAKYKTSLDHCTVNAVYKILRPSLEATLKSDYEALEAVAHEFEGSTHRGHRINIQDLVETVKDWIETEKNFMNEVRFHNMLSAQDYSYARDYEEKAGLSIRHPKILYHTESIIVEEEVHGVALMDMAPETHKIRLQDVIDAGYTEEEAKGVLKILEKKEPREARIHIALKKAGFDGNGLKQAIKQILQYDYRAIIQLLRTVLLHQIFVDGLFHADLHQGNVMITPDGGIYMIDRGNAGKLNEAQRKGAKDLIKGTLLRDNKLIKLGIDQIFKYAEYPDNEEPAQSTITVNDIQGILDRNYDTKTTMHMVALKALEGGRRKQGAKDFSIFAKAFTQAMYLFPSDVAHGLETISAISDYIPLTDNEIQDAVVKQAKLIIFDEKKQKEVAEEPEKMGLSARQLEKIMLSIVTEKTSNKFLSKLWQPVFMRLFRAFLVATKPFRKMAIRKGIAMVREHTDEIMQVALKELPNYKKQSIRSLIEKYVDREKVEHWIIKDVEEETSNRFLASLWRSIALNTVRLILVLVRPVTNLLLETMLVWVDSVGGRMIGHFLEELETQSSQQLIKTLLRTSGEPASTPSSKGQSVELSGSSNETIDLIEQDLTAEDKKPTEATQPVFHEKPTTVLPKETGKIQKLFNAQA